MNEKGELTSRLFVLRSLVRCVPVHVPQASREASTHPLRTMVRLAKDTFRSSGVRGMYRGHSLQLALECVGYSVYFTTYEVSMGMRVRVPLACTLL